MPYRPGLDGLRALALLAVLAFHQGAPEARGGYLGVSSFFTLSGFLITTLAIAETRRTGRLSWRRFWERRARRLLPAALVTLAAVLVLQAWTEMGSGARFRGDVLAALGYTANWRLAGASGGYGDLFADPSPVVHFWSLAIEEQFYVLFPLVFAAIVAVVGTRRLWRAGVLAAGAAGASFAAAWVTADSGGNDGLAYYGTHTRAGELLVGVALAFLLADRPAPRSGRGWLPAGAVALVGLVALWSRVAIGDPRLFHGVTALNGLLTALLITAVMRSATVDRALGVQPLRAVGKVSYGAYLYHWPLFLLIAPPTVALTGPRLFAARLAATFAAAAVSYAVVEAPFRFRIRLPRPRLALVVGTAASAVVALALVLPVHGNGYADLATAEAAGAESGSDHRATAAVAPPADAAPAEVRTVFLAGDSVAYSLRTAFHFWNVRGEHPEFQVDTHIAFGCPLGGAGLVRGIAGEKETFGDCGPWHDELPAALDRASPDIVLMIMGLADLNGREIDGTWRPMGDPVHDRWLADRIDVLATELEAGGAPVVWLTFPHVRARDVNDPTRRWETIPINDPAKVDRLNELLAETLSGHPGVTLVDLADWLESWPDQSFSRDDRDGVHFSYGGSDKVGAWLVPQMVALLPPTATSAPPAPAPAPPPPASAAPASASPAPPPAPAPAAASEGPQAGAGSG